MNATPLKLKPSAPRDRTTALLRDWRVLIVDDDVEVHAVTRLILGKMRFKGRGIELLSAHSAAQARSLLEKERDIAVVLLDVVMETDDAGLRLVSVIRKELGNVATRIILRTGQPGQAPEEQVIVDYDINDYKAKSELTAQKLFTTVVAALRSYETIVALEKTRKGLEKILDSTSALFQVHSLQQFAAGVLTQLSAFLGCQPNGIICVQYEPDKLHDSSAHDDGLRVLASTGECAGCVTECLGYQCKHTALLDVVRQALRQLHLHAEDYLAALKDAERVLQLGPPQAEDHLARAEIYDYLDCPQGARFDLQQALLLSDDALQNLHLSQRLRQLQQGPALH